MQHLGLRTDEPPVTTNKAASLPTLNNSGRAIALLILASPILLGLVIALYYILNLGLFTGLITSMALLTSLLIFGQFLIGINRITQTIVSLLQTQRYALSRRLSNLTLTDSPKVQPISIIVWAQNQSEGLAASLKSLLSLNYPDYEIIVINDGSSDNTLEILELEFGLQPLSRVIRRTLPTGPISAIFTSPKYPILTVIEKPRAGRADSLNIGINVAKAPLICVIEPNYMLARDALLLLAKPFIENPNTTLMSAGLGELQVNIDDSAPFLSSIEQVERKRLFHSSLLTRNTFCMVSATHNAARLMRKSNLIEAGGFLNYRADLELCLRLQKPLIDRNKNFCVSFIPDILCWQRELNSDSSSLATHNAWQTATIHAIASNISLLLSPRYGWRISAVLLLFTELLLPTVELIGIPFTIVAALFGAISLEMVLSYFITIITFSLLENLAGILADEFSFRCRHTLPETISLILASTIEVIIFRPIAAFYRLRGAISGLFLNQ